MATTAVRRLWNDVLARYKTRLLVGLSLSIGTAAVTTLQPLVMRDFVNTVATGSSSHLLEWALPLVLIPIGRSALATASTYILAGTGQLITQDLRREIFQKILSAPTSFADSTPAGQLVQLNSVEAGRVGETYISHEVVPALSAIMVVILTSIAMVNLDPALAAVVLFFVILGVLASGRWSSSLKQLEGAYLDLRQRGSHILTEVFSNLRLVKLFNGETEEAHRWGNWLSVDRHFWLRQMVVRNWASQGSSSFSQALSISVVLLVGMLQLHHHATSLGTVVAYIAFVPVMFTAVNSIERAQLGTARISVALDKIYGLLDMEPERQLGAKGTTEIDAVTFDSVTFRYPGRTQGLQNVSFHLGRGQTAVVLGMSGTGKSMLADLITGLYVPQCGRVFIGNLPTGEWDVHALRQRVGIVPQEISLWTGTLRTNLLYGLPDDHVSDDDLKHALERAAMLPLVEKLPQGLDTDIGPRGVQLSGGERQRIALARVFLRQPNLLVFDEPTSALDPILTDNLIRQIREYRPDAIKIIITHRLDVLVPSDLVIIVHGDGTVEAGSPSDMKSSSPVYRDLLAATARMGRN